MVTIGQKVSNVIIVFMLASKRLEALRIFFTLILTFFWLPILLSV